VKAMGGAITARSEPGKGATFRVEIPEASAPPVEGTEATRLPA
jgi:signal transduction histidine kinase